MRQLTRDPVTSGWVAVVGAATILEFGYYGLNSVLVGQPWGWLPWVLLAGGAAGLYRALLVHDGSVKGKAPSWLQVVGVGALSLGVLIGFHAALPIPDDVLAGVKARQSLADWSVDVIAVPIEEEVVYRGLLWAVLHPRVGTAWTNVLTSGLFALGHTLVSVDVWYLVAALSWGLVLGCVRAWSRGILIPIAIHASGNALATL